MKTCEQCDPAIHEGGCNWLDWMVDDAGGVCPHCGGPVTEIGTVTPLGQLFDNMRLDVDVPPGTIELHDEDGIVARVTL